MQPLRCCPFCSSHQVQVLKRGEYLIRCAQCRATGVPDSSLEGVASKWNARYYDDVNAQVVYDESSRLEKVSSNVERNVFSQNGEDGVIEAILLSIDPTCRFALEIGIGTGEETNTRKLVEHDGWTGKWVDIWDIVYIPNGVEYVKTFVNKDNAKGLLSGLPPRLGLLSIDIDGNDLWIWKELGPMADVVVIEYNSLFPPPQSVTVKYEPDLKWDKTDYFGASLSALWKLGRSMGYELVHCDSTGVNAFFVHGDKIGRCSLPPLLPEEAFRPFSRQPYPKDSRQMELYL